MDPVSTQGRGSGGGEVLGTAATSVISALLKQCPQKCYEFKASLDYIMSFFIIISVVCPGLRIRRVSIDLC